MKNNRYFWVMILGFLLITLSACGGGGGSSSGSTSDGSSASPTNATTVIGSAGGSAVSADSSTTIQIPAGALAASTEITITRKEDSYGQIGNIYQIEQQGGEGLSFSNPVIVKVKYDPSLLPSGAKESELMLAVMNPYDSLEFLSDSTVDPINHVVTATTTHFSDVILLPKLSVGAPPTLAFPLHNSNGPFDAAITSVFDHSMDPKKPYYADGIVADYKGEIGNASPDPNFSVTVVTGQKLRGYSNPSIPQFAVNGNYTGGNYLYYDGHPGYDYKTVSTQVPSGQIDVFAAADGIANIGGPKYGTIWIDHGNGYSTWYLHLSQRLVGDNKPVKKGDRIGVSGNTAPFYVGPHLHFEVKRNNVPIDPYSENLWETLTNPSPPSTPTGFTVTPASSSQINLSWTASTGTVTGYKVYKNGGSLLKTVTTTSTSDTGLNASTNYCYYVIAYNSAGDSVQTSQLCATTQNLTSTYSMSGTIHSVSNSGPALSGATVSISGLTATTSSTGTFSIIGIPAGTYAFSVSKSGYDTYTNPAYYVGSNQTSLSFYLTQPTVTYSMSGTIHSVSNSGPVLSGATVSIAGMTVTTGGTGNFSITGIPVGTYAFSVFKSGYDTYINPAYYVGSNQTSLDFYLTQPILTYSISGTIHAASNSGPALPSATVSIAGRTATTSSTGTFLISGIPPSTYAFSVSKSGYGTYTNPAYYVNSNQIGQNFYLTTVSSSLVCPPSNGISLNGIQLYGTTSYQLSTIAANATVTATLTWEVYYQNIYNLPTGSYSGSLRAQLWAVPYSFSGGLITNSYVIGIFTPNFTGPGAYSSNQVYVGGYSTSPQSSSISVQNPPAGTYCMVVTIDEYNTIGGCSDPSGYCYDQWMQYNAPVTFY